MRSVYAIAGFRDPDCRVTAPGGDLRKFFACMLLAFVSACSTEGCSVNSNLSACTGSSIKVIEIPSDKEHDSDLQIRVKVAKKYLPSAEIDTSSEINFLPLDALTFEPVPTSDELDEARTITFTLAPRYIDHGFPSSIYVDRFEDIGLKRFGLSYRPMPVEGRPEELWKRVYTKLGVPNQEFSIACTPPIAPGSISAPKSCAMMIILKKSTWNDRPVGVIATAYLPVERLSEWEDVEAAIRAIFEGNIDFL